MINFFFKKFNFKKWPKKSEWIEKKIKKRSSIPSRPNVERQNYIYIKVIFKKDKKKTLVSLSNSHPKPWEWYNLKKKNKIKKKLMKLNFQTNPMLKSTKT
jgi:hypothetical protein